MHDIRAIAEDDGQFPGRDVALLNRHRIGARDALTAAGLLPGDGNLYLYAASAVEAGRRGYTVVAEAELRGGLTIRMIAPLRSSGPSGCADPDLWLRMASEAVLRLSAALAAVGNDGLTAMIGGVAQHSQGDR